MSSDFRDAPEVLPRDEHNQRLIANVHPESWVNPTPEGTYNLVVIGAGTAGLISALLASSLGAKVALIERHLMGGDCLNVGCVPSKALIRAARRIHEAGAARALGIQVPEDPLPDFGAAMERLREIRDPERFCWAVHSWQWVFSFRRLRRIRSWRGHRRLGFLSFSG